MIEADAVVARPAIDDTHRERPLSSIERVERRAQRIAGAVDLHDPLTRARLVRRLEQSRSASFIWLLLALLERGPSRAWEGPARLAGLKRLASSDSDHLRFAAYRWLARLHAIDLRCEIAAQRLLREALRREQGLARRRVGQLLRAC